MNLNMYNVTFMQETPDSKGYMLTPKYTPKKWEPKNTSFNTQLNGSAPSNTNNNLAQNSNITEVQKKEWSTKFAGKKELSMEEWDDFLLDLVDRNVIANSDRLEVMGFLIPIGDVKDINLEPNQGVEVHNSCSTGWEDLYPLSKWTGDPFKWIEDMDFYYYKQELNAKMDNRDPECFQRVRRNFSKISDILKEIYA